VDKIFVLTGGKFYVWRYTNETQTTVKRPKNRQGFDKIPNPNKREQNNVKTTL